MKTPFKPDRISLLRRHFWSEINRMENDIASFKRKLELLDEIDAVKLKKRTPKSGE